MINSPSTPLRRVCLLGAPGTGKTQLAADLRASFTRENNPLLEVAIDDNPPLTPNRTHQQKQVSDLTLLMGLDLPALPADQREREAADHALRSALAQSGKTYQVVYGHGAERLRNALRAIHARWPGHADMAAEQPAGNGAVATAGWVWACDKCSDPQCERRLLSDLLAARAGSAAVP